MATVNDIVTRAFRLIGVVAQDEAMGADAGAAGLSAFNDMIQAWALDGVDTGIGDLALTDNFPLAPKFREGVTYVLAARLSPAYSAPAGFDEHEFFRRVQAAYVAAPVATIDPALTWAGSTLRRRGIW